MVSFWDANRIAHLPLSLAPKADEPPKRIARLPAVSLADLLLDSPADDDDTAEDDIAFVTRLNSSLSSLLRTQRRLREGLGAVRALLRTWAAETEQQAAALEMLPALLGGEEVRGEEVSRIRTARVRSERDRAALANALSAMMEAWVLSAEAEADALAEPMGKLTAWLTQPVPQPPQWLGAHGSAGAHDSAETDALRAEGASRVRLQRREAELEKLLLALEAQLTNLDAQLTNLDAQFTRTEGDERLQALWRADHSEGTGSSTLPRLAVEIAEEGGRESPAVESASGAGAAVGTAVGAAMREDTWESRGWERWKLAERRETAEAQHAMRTLSSAVLSTSARLVAQAQALQEEQVRLEGARVRLVRRVELWDADELAPKWQATASWLHPKDDSTAALLERRRNCHRRSEQLLRQAPNLERAVPERLASLASLQARCEHVQRVLLGPQLLQAEEMALVDQLSACAGSLAAARQRCLAARLAMERAAEDATTVHEPSQRAATSADVPPTLATEGEGPVERQGERRGERRGEREPEARGRARFDWRKSLQRV